MRNTSSWKTDACKVLEAAWGEGGSGGDSRRLVDVELVLFLAAEVAPGHPFTDAWALLGGYPFLRVSQRTVPEDHQRMIAVARHLVLRFKDSRDWREALEDYTKYPEQIRGYTLDLATGRQCPRDTSVWPERWEHYRNVLDVPPPYSLGSLTLAHDGRHINQLQPWTSVTIPRWLTGAMRVIGGTGVASHDVTARRDREPLTVTWAELMAAARWGDEAEQHAGVPGRRKVQLGRAASASDLGGSPGRQHVRQVRGPDDRRDCPHDRHGRRG